MKFAAIYEISDQYVFACDPQIIKNKGKEFTIHGPSCKWIFESKHKIVKTIILAKVLRSVEREREREREGRQAMWNDTAFVGAWQPLQSADQNVGFHFISFGCSFGVKRIKPFWVAIMGSPVAHCTSLLTWHCTDYGPFLYIIIIIIIIVFINLFYYY